MDGIKAARAIWRAALRELGVGNGAEAIHAAAEFRESACGSPGVCHAAVLSLGGLTHPPVRIFKDPPPHPPPPTPTTLHRSGPPADFVHMTGPIVQLYPLPLAGKPLQASGQHGMRTAG